ncbi:hypothetical protein D3C87_1990990 [compost metagenome]
MTLVAFWDNHSLLAIEAQGLADAEITLNFFVDATNRHDFTELIQCTGDRYALLDRQAGQG